MSKLTRIAAGAVGSVGPCTVEVSPRKRPGICEMADLGRGTWVPVRTPAPAVLLPAHSGLTLVHSSAQLEPCLTHKNTLHTLNTP